ncbi:MAG: hypothetical protein ACI4XM_07965 [Candidatus Coprovivens sp.]
MKINIKDIITLNDNREYIVVSKVSIKEKIYYYLVENNNTSNIIFCYLNNNRLVEINDNELIIKLLPLFIEAAKNDLES